jgi:hypothetical protein
VGQRSQMSLEADGFDQAWRGVGRVPEAPRVEPKGRHCESGVVPERYFDEGVAARYDETIGSWGDPEVVARTICRR